MLLRYTPSHLLFSYTPHRPHTAVADAVRTSLGPRGMDKMIQNQDGEVLITNDGATILDQMTVFHPTAKMLVGLSKSQDIEAGDGTTSVVVIAGSLLDSCQGLLDKGIHPTKITECFLQAEVKALEILRSVAIPVSQKKHYPERNFCRHLALNLS